MIIAAAIMLYPNLYSLAPRLACLRVGSYEIAFGQARLTQGPSQGSQGGTITCQVPDTVPEENDDDFLPTAQVDAACICCELVARVRPEGAEDVELEEVLRVVLRAMTGRVHPAAEVSTLFQQRFKSAGGGRRLLLGPGACEPTTHAEEEYPPAAGGQVGEVAHATHEDQAVIPETAAAPVVPVSTPQGPRSQVCLQPVHTVNRFPRTA